MLSLIAVPLPAVPVAAAVMVSVASAQSGRLNPVVSLQP